jgi:Zn-dependent oligopeptidase
MSNYVFDQRSSHRMLDFRNFNIDQLLPSAKEGLKRARARIDNIVQNHELPTFENTILAFNNHSVELDFVESIYGYVKRAHMTPELDKISEEFEKLASDYTTELFTNAALFERIRFIKENADQMNLNQQELAAVERKFRNFTDNGALLSAESQERLKTLNVEIAIQRKTYQNNMTNAVKVSYLPVEDEAALKGFPESFLKLAAKKASELQINAPYAITFDAPTYTAAMNNIEDRNLRKMLFDARTLMTQSGENDNRQVALDIIRLRHERANLFGAKTHADYTLKYRMVNSPDKAFSFINKLIVSSSIAETQEMQSLTEFARAKDGLEVLEPWDVRYYINQSKKEAGLDAEKLRDYFEVDQVVDSCLSHFGALFGLEFKESQEYTTLHPDIKVFEMRRDPAQETPTAIYLFDLYTRDGKKSGAWEAPILHRALLSDGSIQIPIVTINTNYMKAPDGEKTYITLSDYETMHHEMGHGLHVGLSVIEHGDISSSTVAWDFVELPSMALEKYALTPEVLRASTKHRVTGEPMSEELMREIKDQGQEFPGIFLKRQALLSLFDMVAYTTDPKNISSITELEDQVRESIGNVAYERSFSHNFHHPFSGGYSSGYYSYFWADVLANDAFAKLTQNGTYDPQAAKSFEDNILAKGSMEPADELYRAFAGNDPDVNVLFRELKLPEIDEDGKPQILAATPPAPSI